MITGAELHLQIVRPDSGLLSLVHGHCACMCLLQDDSCVDTLLVLRLQVPCGVQLDVRSDYLERVFVTLLGDTSSCRCFLNFSKYLVLHMLQEILLHDFSFRELLKHHLVQVLRVMCPHSF